jgi:hypothetical protein
MTKHLVKVITRSDELLIASQMYEDAQADIAEFIRSNGLGEIARVELESLVGPVPQTEAIEGFWWHATIISIVECAREQ